MNEFKIYLQHRNYRDNTIKGHLQNIGYFLDWITANGLYEPENLRYADLLSYIQYEQQRQKDPATINLRLGSISKYFDFLKQQGTIDRNMVKLLRVKGKTKKVLEHPLEYEELLSLYQQYSNLYNNRVFNKMSAPATRRLAVLTHERNTVILGLLIWQGLHSGVLPKLETTHVQLKEATIYIPATVTSNSRTLKLQPQQILALHDYLQGGIREQLKPKADELLPGNMHNVINRICGELKGINPQIKNALHIRSSVIINWLKQYNKRQVQYMAGHRSIMSTEYYDIQRLDVLIDELTKHHPFGN
jgi:site-specific recombinase XerD